MTGQLVQPFPQPAGDELRQAFLNLYLSQNGTDEQKKQVGNPTKLPRPWDPPTCTNPKLRGQLWTWLEEFVTWFNHEYVWDHNAGMIPACWPKHPHLVHEIAVLADQRRRAGLDPTSSALEEWHRYGVPGFLERLKTRTKNGCDECHTRWPAEARYTRASSPAGVSGRSQIFDGDVTGLRSPKPVTQARPPLHLIQRPDGELLNPDTGEVF